MISYISKKCLITIYLMFAINTFSGAKDMGCITLHKIEDIDEKAQAFIDDIFFNVQIMQDRININEVLERASSTQKKYYQSGKLNTISFSIKNGMWVSNDITYHEGITPKYSIAYKSLIWSPSEYKVGLSVALIEQVLDLGKCRMSESGSLDFMNKTKLHYFYYEIPSGDYRYPDAYIRIGVHPPSHYKEGDLVSKTLQDNLGAIEIGRGGYSQHEISTLHSGQPATREGLWKPAAPINHLKAEYINSSVGVFMRRGDILPNFGLDTKEETKIKWHWMNNGVEFLKEQK